MTTMSRRTPVIFAHHLYDIFSANGIRFITGLVNHFSFMSYSRGRHNLHNTTKRPGDLIMIDPHHDQGITNHPCPTSPSVRLSKATAKPFSPLWTPTPFGSAPSDPTKRMGGSTANQNSWLSISKVWEAWGICWARTGHRHSWLRSRIGRRERLGEGSGHSIRWAGHGRNTVSSARGRPKNEQ